MTSGNITLGIWASYETGGQVVGQEFDFYASYSDLLQRSNTMSVTSYLKYMLSIEVYKCINNLSPDYLCDLFEIKVNKYDMRDNRRIIQNRFN